MLDDDACSCYSTLEIGHPMCGDSWDSQVASGDTGVDAVNGDGCNGP